MDIEDITWILKVVFIGIITIIVLLLGVSYFSYKEDTKIWNNGYCTCGGKWEYQQAIGHQYNTAYIYKCDECGKIVELSNVY